MEQSHPSSRLSRYTSIIGKRVLEIGGNDSSDSAKCFIDMGAESVVVTGLEHISTEVVSDHRITIRKADAHFLSDYFPSGSFDIIYGVNIIEHIPILSKMFSEVSKVLSPGGLCFFNGGPIWSSPIGHHLWVDWKYRSGRFNTTNFYSFHDESCLPGAVNPLPPWSHLLWSEDEMARYLRTKSIPDEDVECIVDWVYHNKSINRMNQKEIVNSFLISGLNIVDMASDYDSSSIVWGSHRKVTEYPLINNDVLREKCGDVLDYTVGYIEVILSKSK